uniref:Uncharacterized protein n=1 Tax=viral metagenome TaxID=1070528 RepID=A0A6M3XG89_9ZZZZ
MCWKQEWAQAISNLQKAIEHVEKARGKLIKRRERNEANLKKKGADRYEKKKIEARIEKNQRGQEQCEKIIADLKDWQDQLFRMIHEYGITRSDNPKTVYKLMGKYPVAEKLKEYEP